jgi:hypothetical protein
LEKTEIYGIVFFMTEHTVATGANKRGKDGPPEHFGHNPEGELSGRRIFYIFRP